MKRYIRNDAAVTDEFIQTLESQDEAEEQLSKIRKQTRRWRGLTAFWGFVLVVILLYSVVTVIKDDGKQKTYFVDIERSIPELSFSSLEEYEIPITYYYKSKGSSRGNTSCHVGIYADDGYNIANIDSDSGKTDDSFVKFAKWLEKRDIVENEETTQTERFYETEAVASLLNTTRVDYKVKSVAKSEKKFKCSPAVHIGCGDSLSKTYRQLVSSYFNEDYATIFSEIQDYEVVESNDNEYLYISFYDKNVDIDEVSGVVAEFLSDNVGYFDKMEFGKLSYDPVTVVPGGYKNIGHSPNLHRVFGTQLTTGKTSSLESAIHELYPDAVIGRDEEAPVIAKFCISGEYYELFAYILHMYDLI